MTDRELRRLSRMELLEILLDQRKRIDELEKELEETRQKAESREILIRNCGSLAEASVQLTDVFLEAQKAADLYLENVSRMADEYLEKTKGPDEAGADPGEQDR